MDYCFICSQTIIASFVVKNFTVRMYSLITWNNM